MPDKTDSQDFDSDGKNIEKLEKERIALAYIMRDISDDNPSDINGLTSLDQLIVYKFNLEDSENFEEDLEKYKKEIVLEAMCFDECEEDEIFISPPEVNEKEFLYRLGKMILLDIVTDDKRSRFSDLTALGEIIAYEFGYITIEKEIEIKKKIKAMTMLLRGGSTIKKSEDIDNSYETDKLF